MLDKAKQNEQYIVNLRRYFHMHPELSGQEFQTKQVIVDELKKLGIEVKHTENTSVIGILKGGSGGKTVALRADMDALPMEEQSGVEFSSQNPGVMHGCGHDAHAAMLLGAAKILSEMKSEISGEVRFFFQEGEETFTGAKKIIKAGGMDGVDACFGMHGLPTLETGFVDITPGYRMSGCDTIYVKFEGVSGHGSAPHLAKDTIYPACVFAGGVQAIATKNIDPQQPVVLSMGRFHGGTKANIIAKYTEVDISMRYFEPKVRETVHEAIKRHAQSVADMYEIKAEVVIEEGALSLCNDEETTVVAQKAAAKIFGEDNNITMPRLMASEDFPYYQQHAKGTYANVGFKNAEKGCVYFPHHEKFKIDEDFMKYGAALYAQFAIDFLND